MESLEHLVTIESLKAIGDSRRLAILRLLMAGPATLSQLSKSLHSYPSKVRHHVKQLERAGLITLATTRVVGGYVEKYYQATARAFMINMTIVPQTSAQDMIIASGSHDLALEQLAQQMQNNGRFPDLFTLPIGSLDGLIALRQGLCQIAGAHLLDANGRDYNHSYVQHLFPGRDMTLLTLTHREQGLLLPPGNPKHIKSLTDLTRGDVVFVNRAQGTGTRLWLDQQLAKQGIDTAVINGYDTIAAIHHDVATAIAQGHADVGVAVLAVAQQHNLDFIPLFDERYDLILPTDSLEDPTLQPLFEHLQTSTFRQAINGLNGYDATNTGAFAKVTGTFEVPVTSDTS